ncbi:hypothetical protein CASFOL_029142 [Castilleja foliolosa]|uniref:Protein kinase domain-containing protein n=1 Tax=Castilleja foliolosa TaxID=1961234 RepID=A0ABD3CE03_9LAMI
MTKHLKFNHLLLLLLTTILSITHLTSAIDLLFNGFGPSDVSRYLHASIESRILTLNNGRALYPSRIPTKQPNSSLVLPFSTSFVFAIIAPPHQGNSIRSNGVVFCFVPRDGVSCSNPTAHFFGVVFVFDTGQYYEEIDDNRVEINVNSSVSVRAHESGYWPDDGRGFRRLRLANGRNYQVWIDYVGGVVNVTMAPVGIVNRPNRPLLSVPFNLSDAFGDEMYVGFEGFRRDGGPLGESNKILAWSFSNTNFSFSEGLITSGLPNLELPKTPIHRTKGFVAGRRNQWRIGNWSIWPHRLAYQEIESATNGFSEENVIGVGGNGKVYKGVFSGGLEVAVKRISRESNEGLRAFTAEISSLGRLKHRNLVGLRGWCKKDKGNLILVYDYMENGSLDKRVFECDDSKMLSFEERSRILKQVASGVMYLHFGWKSKVLHRDIKASNVLLDKEMNARLGDFGLARIHDHDDKSDGATSLVGTVGYLAPEIVRSGKTSTETDVFGYGVLVLEVICGRRPIEQGKPLLVDWLLELLRKGELINGVDPRLRTNGVFDERMWKR